MCEPEGAGVSISVARLAIGVAIAGVLATPAEAQVDLTGEWPVSHPAVRDQHVLPPRGGSVQVEPDSVPDRGPAREAGAGAPRWPCGRVV